MTTSSPTPQRSPSSPPAAPTVPAAPGPPAGLLRFNAAADADALTTLHAVCASRAWAKRVLAGRPYPRTGELLTASDDALARLTADDLAEAMAGHPPIGRPTPGDATSAREQSGMATAGDRVTADMLALNDAYQRRFGHVFLICATGLTGEQLRDALRARLGNPPEREREIVRTELRGINRIRLTRLAAPPATVSTHILDTSAGRPAPGVTVTLAARAQDTGDWTALGGGTTDADGRCTGLPELPPDTAEARLTFRTGDHLAGRTPGGRAFFPEATIVFAPAPGEHHHLPLLLNPFGYSVYRGS
ncbi:2-oxo-4-hydroxy-4-carboxy-5-ureidoimidazoline decarboxylase [Streptomyces yaizuensis]|uniref:2-oxo-4-hydroxy-4-carboxy-5-ureidoimidazoline decarboxylase n=1 Tax=Streptomyces yaizuensis TaxID=2989713 RepID=A0ABQ5P5W4_9ACTN|nr:2-oxo-4-hydroxy-4-carboxy-5-ureidoimidazoline decarboxylase [Streptomyces sp. YSPA8]GLF97960.1 2-oxo-4-hydroxy-4-carboxy-5-ureidoimidazoline decarboxylase [Streptomyces sp. YSPA8]